MSINFTHLLSDHILVRLDPPESFSSLILIEENPFRTGVVLMTGPGRWVKTPSSNGYRDIFRPVEVRVGERVAFPIGSTDTKIGKSITHYLQDGERIIKENDILFVIPDGLTVKVSL